MSWEASAWAMAKGRAYELEPTTRFVMLTMANYADKEGNDIYPSLRTLEADTGLEETTIRRHIKKLIAVGLLDYGDQSIVANNPKFRNDRLPKVYRFLFEGPAGPDFSHFGKVPTSRPDKPERGSKARGGTVQARDEKPQEIKADDPASSPSRGGTRGGTVQGKPISLQENQETPGRSPCRQCRLPVRDAVLNPFGLCPDCVPSPPAPVEGSGYAAFRAARQALAGSKEALDVK